MKSWLLKSFGNSKHHKSASNLQRLSLIDEASLHRGVSSPCGSNAGSLSTSSNCSVESNNTVRNPMARRSLPAMHLNEHSSFQDSCAMMDNPPMFDNPLRRRGCFDHKHTEQMSTYRQEAIKRELQVKRHMRSSPLSDSVVA